MAKSRTTQGVTLTYPATTAYKQWVWKEIRRRGWTQQKLVDEMKRTSKRFLLGIVDSKGKTMYETISTSTITNLIGPEEPDEPPPATNCAFMPALNEALEIEPPPVCDPNDELSRLIDRFRSRWANMRPREQRLLIEILRGEDDEPAALDRSCGRAGEAADRDPSESDRHQGGSSRSRRDA